MIAPVLATPAPIPEGLPVGTSTIGSDFLQHALLLAFNNYYIPVFSNTYLRICAILHNSPACVWNVDVIYPLPAYGNFVDLENDHTSFIPSSNQLTVLSITTTELVVSDGDCVWQIFPYAVVRDCRSGLLFVNWMMLSTLYPSQSAAVEVLLVGLTRPMPLFPPPSDEAEPWAFRLEESVLRSVTSARIRPRRRRGADLTLPACKASLLRVIAIYGSDLTVVNGHVYVLRGNKWALFVNEATGNVHPPTQPPPPPLEVPKVVSGVADENVKEERRVGGPVFKDKQPPLPPESSQPPITVVATGHTGSPIHRPVAQYAKPLSPPPPLSPISSIWKHE